MPLVPFGKRSARPSERSLVDGLLGDVSILDRLDDLRRRLVRSAVAACLGMLVGFALINRIVDVILAPTRHALPSGTQLIYTEPGEAFGLYIQVALIAGVVIAMPYIMFQIWALISPIVPPSVRRFTIPFVLFTTLGFVGGVASRWPFSPPSTGTRTPCLTVSGWTTSSRI